jgi:[acyl-carrier-protein] S-malonyltransferase
VVSNVEAAPVEGAAEIPRLLEAQVTAPVRWTDCVEAIAAHGVDRWVELGSGKVLTGLVGRIQADADARAVADPDGLAAALTTAATEEEAT